MKLDSAEFRRILGHWATGVAVVATRTPGGEPVGLTANAVTSLSLDPPLVLVCVDHASDSLDHIRQAGSFSVNMLREGDERTARRFAEGDGTGRFDGIAWRDHLTGSPVLDEALAWVECRIRREHDGGDHVIFIGEVIAGDAAEGSPLVFYRGGYARMTP
jgi:flavin reductase (DIM6/NTAB) family NADH-FMN oxidoreductase RutF